MQLVSGRPRGGGKTLVEDFPRVDLRHALRGGALREGWLNAGLTADGVRYDLDLDTRVIILAARIGSVTVTRPVSVFSMAMPQGRGVRWSAICPRSGCVERCVVLFIADDPSAPFACRHCIGAVYQVERLTAAGRLALKARRLRERVAGPDPGSIADPFPRCPRTMGETEHERLRVRHDQAVDRYRELVRTRVARLVERHRASETATPINTDRW